MTTRRHILAAASLLAAPALAQQVVRIPREWVPTDVEVAPGLAPGVIHVDTAHT